MREKTRLLGPSQTKRHPTDFQGWRNLLLQTIERVERLNRNSVPLRSALGKNQCETILRRMGIICQADIDREFPLP